MANPELNPPSGGNLSVPSSSRQGAAGLLSLAMLGGLSRGGSPRAGRGQSRADLENQAELLRYKYDLMARNAADDYYNQELAAGNRGKIMIDNWNQLSPDDRKKAHIKIGNDMVETQNFERIIRDAAAEDSGAEPTPGPGPSPEPAPLPPGPSRTPLSDRLKAKNAPEPGPEPGPEPEPGPMATPPTEQAPTAERSRWADYGVPRVTSQPGREFSRTAMRGLSKEQIAALEEQEPAWMATQKSSVNRRAGKGTWEKDPSYEADARQMLVEAMFPISGSEESMTPAARRKYASYIYSAPEFGTGEGPRRAPEGPAKSAPGSQFNSEVSNEAPEPPTK